MRCPNKHCGIETSRMVIKTDRSGKVSEGCPACLPPIGTAHLYTGKKIWAGSQAYTPSQIEQKNHDWFDRTANRAADMRKRDEARVRPSLRNKGGSV